MLQRVTTRLKQAIRLRKRKRQVLNRRAAAEAEILEAIEDFELDLKRHERMLRRLEREDRRPRKRESLAEEIEELEAALDELYERLDVREHKSAQAERQLERGKTRVQRLRRRRKAIIASLGDLTPNFSFVEFDCREGDPCPTYMRDDCERLCKLFLEQLRAKFGACRITSPHRWSWYNARIGGAQFSFHVYEDRKAYPAADMWFERGTPSQWAAEARRIADSLGFGGVGQYSTFLHVDTRPYRSNWWG